MVLAENRWLGSQLFSKTEPNLQLLMVPIPPPPWLLPVSRRVLGSVLGPTLFLLFINDISSVTSSQLRLFADDTVLYKAINCNDDQHVLQEDLSNLSKWASDWQMAFNVTKYAIYSVSQIRVIPLIDFIYSMNSEVLSKVSESTLRCTTVIIHVEVVISR